MKEIKNHQWKVVKNGEYFALVNEENTFYTDMAFSGDFLFGYSYLQIRTYKTLEEAEDFQKRLNWTNVE